MTTKNSAAIAALFDKVSACFTPDMKRCIDRETFLAMKPAAVTEWMCLLVEHAGNFDDDEVKLNKIGYMLKAQP